MSWENKKSIRIMFKRKEISNNKREGFTLIELIAVMAIIGILVSIILPKFSGYIKEAKKTKVIDQCRKVVMAVESYNLRYSSQLRDDITVASATSNKGVNKYLDNVKLDNIDSNSTTLKNCRDILNGAEFDFVTDTEVLDSRSIEVIKEDIKKNANIS